MTDRDRIDAMIQEAVSDCYPYWSIVIADHLIAGGVVVREKGEWEIIRDDYDNELMRCPVCHAEMYDGENDTVDSTPKFCPNCGADMRKESTND